MSDSLNESRSTEVDDYLAKAVNRTTGGGKPMVDGKSAVGGNVEVEGKGEVESNADGGAQSEAAGESHSRGKVSGGRPARSIAAQRQHSRRLLA